MSVRKRNFRNVLFENKNLVSTVQEFWAESRAVKEKEKFVGSRQMSKNSCGQRQFQFSTGILTGICEGSGAGSMMIILKKYDFLRKSLIRSHFYRNLLNLTEEKLIFVVTKTNQYFTIYLILPLRGISVFPFS